MQLRCWDNELSRSWSRCRVSLPGSGVVVTAQTSPCWPSVSLPESLCRFHVHTRTSRRGSLGLSQAQAPCRARSQGTEWHPRLRSRCPIPWLPASAFLAWEPGWAHAMQPNAWGQGILFKGPLLPALTTDPLLLNKI